MPHLRGYCERPPKTCGEIKMKNYTNRELANMSREQMADLARSFPSRLDWKKAKEWTGEQKLVQSKLDCLNMIDANLVYGDRFWQKQTGLGGEYNYADAYVKEIGEENVRELYEARKEYFRHHVRVHTDVYTDSEGVSYNSMEEY